MSIKMTDVVDQSNDTGSDEVPDDFFDEFDDNKFLDEIVENVVLTPEQSRVIRSENSPTKANDDQTTNNDEEPMVRRCLDEIDKLTKSIQRRKRRLREGNDRTIQNNKDHSHSRDRVRSKSPSFKRSGKIVRDRDRRSTSRRSPIAGASRYHSRDRSRSRSRERRSNRSRDRRLSRNRRDKRSRSKSPGSQPRTMTFIEELEHKFAENGQEFPEKNLLMQLQSRRGIDPLSMPAYSVNMPYLQCDVPQSAPSYLQLPMPIYNQPYQPQWNGSYMNNINTMQHSLQSIPMPTPVTGNMAVWKSDFESNRGSGNSSWNPPANKAEAVAKCRDASKILRSEENKVPKLRFRFTRTSMPITGADEKKFPLHSRKNVQFELTADDQQSVAPLQFLPPRTRELVKILGYSSSNIISRLRLKQFADKMIHDIEDTEKKKTKEKSFTECGMQTESYKCPNCINRESKTFVNKAVQIDGPKKVSIRTQTNERDYREPLIRSLSRMTPGQLVAVSDFAKLICEPRPSTSAEIVKVREQLMDIFNLSERGPEAIEAEWEREQEIRRRINNSSIAGPPMEDLRVTMRSSSDNNMGRIPPPPPILANYHLNDNEIEMRRIAEEEERDRRLQQLRFEENRRFQLEKEQRIREMEWEREQQLLIQQQQQMQQQQLQLQREQEEEALLLQMSRNDRKRNGRGRGQHWNGRGRGRY